MINLLQRIFIWIYRNFNIKIELNSVKKESKNRQNKLNLILSGSYHINGFALDIVTEHYQERQKQSFEKYDIRSDLIPYQDSTVDNIYVSHVLEHIENIQKFFSSI